MTTKDIYQLEEGVIFSNFNGPFRLKEKEGRVKWSRGE